MVLPLGQMRVSTFKQADLLSSIVLLAQVIHPVLVAVLRFQHSNDIFGTVPVELLDALASRKAHSHYTRRDVGQI